MAHPLHHSVLIVLPNQMTLGSPHVGPECESALSTWDFQQLAFKGLLPPTVEGLAATDRLVLHEFV